MKTKTNADFLERVQMSKEKRLRFLDSKQQQTNNIVFIPSKKIMIIPDDPNSEKRKVAYMNSKTTALQFRESILNKKLGRYS